MSNQKRINKSHADLSLNTGHQDPSLVVRDDKS